MASALPPRVLDTTTLTTGEVVGAITAAFLRCPRRCPAMSVLAVDGGAGAGKSTLAELVAAGLADDDAAPADAPAGTHRVGIVHTDELLAGWDDQFEFWPRLRRGVLAPLCAGRNGSFDAFDWVLEKPVGKRTISPVELLVVEGVSAIAACADYASLRVWCDVPRKTREERWVHRDGMPVQPTWQRWLDREDDFFTRHPPDADIVVRSAADVR